MFSYKHYHICLFGTLLVSAACGENDERHTTGIEALEEAFGGPVDLAEYIQGNAPEDIIDTFEVFDVGYTAHAVTSSIRGCAEQFASSLRNRYHQIDGERYYIDSSGRPSRAYTYYPPIRSEGRSSSCQLNVGRWGDAENPRNDYDGGHLIGSQLGGWGARANLVPQDTNFNRGQYVRLENRVARCRNLPSNRLFYYVRTDYPNRSTLIPSRYLIILEDRSTGREVRLNLSNTDGGGSRGRSEIDRGIAFLNSIGCS